MKRKALQPPQPPRHRNQAVRLPLWRKARRQKTPQRRLLKAQKARKVRCLHLLRHQLRRPNKMLRRRSPLLNLSRHSSPASRSHRKRGRVKAPSRPPQRLLVRRGMRLPRQQAAPLARRRCLHHRSTPPPLPANAARMILSWFLPPAHAVARCGCGYGLQA